MAHTSCCKVHLLAVPIIRNTFCCDQPRMMMMVMLWLLCILHAIFPSHEIHYTWLFYERSKGKQNHMWIFCLERHTVPRGKRLILGHLVTCSIFIETRSDAISNVCVCVCVLLQASSLLAPNCSQAIVFHLARTCSSSHINGRWHWEELMKIQTETKRRNKCNFYFCAKKQQSRMKK